VYAPGNPLRCVLPICFFAGAYYAAQIGISLKAVSTPNRTFLAALLTTLESLRSTVGSSDAVTVDSASSAYVENFALRVFASADTEDRRGAATRKTAKKFLAAATFFDVLNVFDDSGPWEAVSLAFLNLSFVRLILRYHRHRHLFRPFGCFSISASTRRKCGMQSGEPQRSPEPFGKAVSQRPYPRAEKQLRLPPSSNRRLLLPFLLLRC